MRNSRTNTTGGSGISWIYLPILSILSSIFLFLLLYGLVVQWENEHLNYAVIALFSLSTGMLLAKLWQGNRSTDHGNKIYHQIFERDSDIIQMVYRISDAKFSYVSPNIQQILGYRSGEIGFSFFRSCFKKDDHEEWMRFFDTGAFNDAGKKMLDLKMSTKFGYIKWINWQAALVKNQKGEVEFIIFALSDISQRKEQEQSNEQYLKELEQIITDRKQEQEKEDNRLDLSVVSELKEPIRSVSDYVHLLESRFKKQQDEKGLDFLKAVKKALSKANHRLDDVATIAGIEKLDNVMKKVNFNEVINKVQRNLAYKIYESGASIKSGPLPELLADQFQMEQLFQNLIENALTYNLSVAPCVTISCEELNDQYVFEITDNGLGIKPKHQKGIFEMFTKAHPKVKHSGTGIGLAICKRICEKHDGKIWMESVGEGKGSSFYISLPLQDSWQEQQLVIGEELKHLDLFFAELQKSETI